jgi:hypothetical protein
VCLTRRDVLLAGAAGVAGALLPRSPAAAAPPTAFATTRFGLVDVIPRSTWGPNLPVKGTLKPETVKFLLVHHTASPNGYGENDVVRYLTSFHTLHTGPDKGWPDVAYNFFVDRFGRIFEGRTGSLKGPVEASATGGNQGFSQLACLIGDFTKEAPSAAALKSLSALLASMAARDGVSLAEGAEVTFKSRGSNKYKEGVSVETSTIAGHRDMSLTACPGDACYPLVRTKIAAAARQASLTTAAPGATGVPGSTDPAAPPVTEDALAPATSGLPPASATEAELDPGPVPETAAAPPAQIVIEHERGGGGTPLWPVLGVGGLTVAAAAGFVLRRRILLQRAEAASFAVRATEYEP